MCIRAILLILSVSASALAADLRMDLEDWPVKIGGEAQLFVDEYLIARRAGVGFRVHPPEKHPGNPLLVPSAALETLMVAYGSVLRDPQTGRFRMWYTNNVGIAYAASENGVRWNKPPVGMAIDGKPTNVLMRGHRGRSDTLTVLPNPDASDPSRRFLAYAFEYRFPDRDGVQERLREGLYLRTSADGIHWQERPEPVMYSTWRSKVDRPEGPPDDLGDVHHIAWDPKLKKFMGHIKIARRGVRTRGLVESDDGIHFSNPRLILEADAQDRPGDQLYSMIAFPYESAWLGYLGMYHKGTDERMDIQLVTSRDGRHWSRGPRQPFLPNGPAGAWDWGVLHMSANAPLRVGDKLYIYYGGIGVAHNVKAAGATQMGIGLAMLRPDGFVSVDASSEPGTLVTRPICFQGKRLTVNAVVRQGGSIRISILDHHFVPIEGYALADAVGVEGDGLKMPVRWRGTAELPPTNSDRHVRLQFHLENAELYSFRVE